MPFFQVTDTCFINGELVLAGSEPVTLDAPTAKYLTQIHRGHVVNGDPDPHDPSTTYASSGTSTPAPSPTPSKK